MIVCELLTTVLQPSLVRYLEVHHCQERIHSVLFLYDCVENCIHIFWLPTFSKQCLLVDVELGFKLIDLHLFVDLHVSIPPSHASVEHLIEVDIAIIRLNCHLKYLFLQLLIINQLLREAQLLILFAKKPEKLLQLLLFYLLATVLILSELLPNFHKTYLVGFKSVQHVVLW